MIQPLSNVISFSLDMDFSKVFAMHYSSSARLFPRMVLFQLPDALHEGLFICLGKVNQSPTLCSSLLREDLCDPRGSLFSRLYLISFALPEEVCYSHVREVSP